MPIKSCVFLVEHTHIHTYTPSALGVGFLWDFTAEYRKRKGWFCSRATVVEAQASRGIVDQYNKLNIHRGGVPGAMVHNSCHCGGNARRDSIVRVTAASHCTDNRCTAIARGLNPRPNLPDDPYHVYIPLWGAPLGRIAKIKVQYILRDVIRSRAKSFDGIRILLRLSRAMYGGEGSHSHSPYPKVNISSEGVKLRKKKGQSRQIATTHAPT